MIVGYEGYILLVCLIEKLIYFVNISHNPMNSDPKYTTSCRDPLLNIRNVINLFLEPEIRPPLEVSTIGVIFGAHGDFAWPMLPRGHFVPGLKSKL